MYSYATSSTGSQHRWISMNNWCRVMNAHQVVKSCSLLLLLCVYLDYQIAQPSFWMGATLGCVWIIVLYVVFSLSFFIIFVILLAVSLSSVCSLENISVFFYFCGVGCMYPFAFVKYMFLCFIWFATFTANYVVVFASVIVFYIQHSCLCF